MSSSSDWVAARQACSIPAQFEYLCKAVRADINARNDFKERQDIGTSMFRFDRRNHGAVSVVTRADGKLVTISIADDTAAIEIRGHTDREMNLAVTLNDRLECMLV